jgi:type I restriction enzyme S subunit
MPDMDPRHLAIIQQILRNQIPDRTVWLFGSRANGSARPSSDADIVILGDASIGLNRLANLREAFQISNLPFQIDILEWVNIKEDFRSVIQKQYVVL